MSSSITLSRIVVGRRYAPHTRAHTCVRKRSRRDRFCMRVNRGRGARVSPPPFFFQRTRALLPPFFHSRIVAWLAASSDPTPTRPTPKRFNHSKSYIENRIFFLSLLLSSIGRISPSLEFGEKKERRIARRIAKLARVRRDKKGTRMKETSL